jgi:RNA polymerase sigma factor (sigma-70 family)
MDSRVQQVIFEECLNRYKNLFFKLIIDKFPNREDAKDVYQEFCIHLFTKIGLLYPEQSDLFDTKSWLSTVVNNFCISILRKRNGKRQVAFVNEEKSSLMRANYSEGDDSFDENLDQKQKIPIEHALDEALRVLDKRDILILKMKYYYGKPSIFISKKMNETHVDVYIGRLKERLKKKIGIKNLDDFLIRYNIEL